MKKISSNIAPHLVYIVIATFLIMLLIPFISGGLTIEQLFIVLLFGYLPIIAVLLSILYIYVEVYVDLENYDVEVQRFFSRKRIRISKASIIKISKLRFISKSPTYYIKYKNENGNRYFLFTRKIFENENYFLMYK